MPKLFSKNWIYGSDTSQVFISGYHNLLLIMYILYSKNGVYVSNSNNFFVEELLYNLCMNNNGKNFVLNNTSKHIGYNNFKFKDKIIDEKLIDDPEMCNIIYNNYIDIYKIILDNVDFYNVLDNKIYNDHPQLKSINRNIIKNILDDNTVIRFLNGIKNNIPNDIKMISLYQLVSIYKYVSCIVLYYQNKYINTIQCDIEYYINSELTNFKCNNNDLSNNDIMNIFLFRAVRILNAGFNDKKNIYRFTH